MVAMTRRYIALAMASYGFVWRDRRGGFEPKIVPKYGSNTNELDKISGLYARAVSTRDIQDTLANLHGAAASPSTIGKITEKVWDMVQAR